MSVAANTVHIMADRLGVGSDRLTALKSRIEHLQRLGFPNGTNTGKGRRACRDDRQHRQLEVALRMTACGVQPEAAVEALRAIQDGVLDSDELVIALPNRIGTARAHIYLDMRPLFDEMRDAGPTNPA